MRANRVREAWAAGRAVINGWCGIPSGFSAELMAHMGWDFAGHRHAARRRRLQGHVVDAAGHLDHRGDADGASAVERPGAHHEGARRRRLRHHLPDDQQPRGVLRDLSALAATRPPGIAARDRSAPRSMAVPIIRKRRTTPSSPLR